MVGRDAFLELQDEDFRRRQAIGRELVTREREWEAYQEWADDPNHQNLVEIMYGEVMLPFHVVENILSYMKYGRQLLETFSKSQEFYFAVMRTWPELNANDKNWYKIPKLVWASARKIKITKTDYGEGFLPLTQFFITENRNLSTLSFRGSWMGDWFAKEIAESLKFNKNVDALYFGRTLWRGSIGDEGRIALKEMYYSERKVGVDAISEATIANGLVEVDV